MELSVKYCDNKGIINDVRKNLSYLTLIKHMAISGQGYLPKVENLRRCIGMFFNYYNYMDLNAFKENHFSTPKGYAYDPTEKNHFSNIIGKSIADYLSKEISGGILTFNYEAAMKIRKDKIKGKRPDLLCVNGKEIFALEAKGFSKKSINNKDMKDHKDQSKTGPIPVKFSIASVTYNIFSEIKVKYYDPVNSNFKYDYELIKKLSIQYYSGLLQYINKNIFNIETIELNSKTYYKINLDNKMNPYMPYFCICGVYKVSLLLNNEIGKFAINGFEGFDLEEYNDEDIYIDTDGVGIMIEKY